MKIIRIDGHVHVDGDFTNIEKLEKSLELLFYEMDELNIQKALIMPNNFQQSNEMIIELCKKYSDKLFGFCWAEFDGGLPQNHLVKFRYCVEKLGFKGLKIHPRYHGVSIKDKRVEELVELAGEYNVPVYFDCLPSKGRVPIQETIPLLIDELAMRYPSTNIVIAHMGGHHILDSYAAVKNNDNIYLELSNIIIRYSGSSVIKDIEFVIRELASEKRIIFGSDFPTYSIKETYSLYNEMFSRLKMKNRDIEFIMGGTINSLIE